MLFRIARIPNDLVNARDIARTSSNEAVCSSGIVQLQAAHVQSARVLNTAGCNVSSGLLETTASDRLAFFAFTALNRRFASD